jgi:hypothetical protein
MSSATNQAEPNNRELEHAKYAPLTSRARTEQAHILVDHLLAQITGAAQGRRQYAKTQRQLRHALEGLLGDLLRAQNLQKANGWTYRSLRAESFTGEDIGYRTFTHLIKKFNALGLIHIRKGFQKWFEGFDPGGPKLPHWKYATRFRATEGLLAVCSRHGISVTDVNEHFIAGLPKAPLQKRASSKRTDYGKKLRGHPMRFEPTPQTEELEQQVRELNEFFARFDLRGGTHRGFIRIFNNGDRSDFNWNKGGRLYSPGEDSYQRMKKRDRLKMTIGGEPVCEIDIRASYLTIYHTWYDQRLDLTNDPYELPGLGKEAREAVKLWFVATFGSAGHLRRWPSEMVKDYHEETDGRVLGKDYPVKLIRQQAIKAFPIMANWGHHEHSWADLMFQESEAMISAMLDLMQEHFVPSLSVHDSLIVPASQRSLAARRLAFHYRWVIGVEPTLKVAEAIP